MTITESDKYKLCLNGSLNNLAAHLEQNRLSHSDGYDFPDVYPTCFARLSRKSIPLMKYPG